VCSDCSSGKQNNDFSKKFSANTWFFRKIKKVRRSNKQKRNRRETPISSSNYTGEIRFCFGCLETLCTSRKKIDSEKKKAELVAAM